MPVVQNHSLWLFICHFLDGQLSFMNSSSVPIVFSVPPTVVKPGILQRDCRRVLGLQELLSVARRVWAMPPPAQRPSWQQPLPVPPSAGNRWARGSCELAWGPGHRSHRQIACFHDLKFSPSQSYAKTWWNLPTNRKWHSGHTILEFQDPLIRMFHNYFDSFVCSIFEALPRPPRPPPDIRQNSKLWASTITILVGTMIRLYIRWAHVISCSSQCEI